MNVSCLNCMKNMRLVDKSQISGNNMTQSEFHCDDCNCRIKVMRQGTRKESETEEPLFDEAES